MEYRPETTPETAAPRRSRWRFAMIGCLVMSAFLVLVIAGLMTFAYKSPYGRSMTDCMMKMKRVGGALDRYADRFDSYPKHLPDLTPDYLPKEDLHCAADARPGAAVSYDYRYAPMDAPDDTVILSCRFHKPNKAESPVYILYRKDGSISVGLNVPR